MKQILDGELQNEFISQDEEVILKSLFNTYTVPIPNEEEINCTIDTLRQYVPQKKKRYQRFALSFNALLQRATAEINFMSKTYWFASLILFVLGSIVTSTTYHNPYAIVMILAPIPFVLGLIELFKGREQRVLELELVCKFSVQQIFLSRFLVIALYNVLLNSVLSIILSSLYPNLALWKMIITWLTPLTTVIALSLWLSLKLRGGYGVTTILAVWLSGITIIFSLPGIVERLAKINVGFYMIIMLAGILMSGWQTSKTLSKLHSEFERGETVELNA